MKPFLRKTNKLIPECAGIDSKLVLEFFQSEFKKKANPDKMIIKKNTLLIENIFPYRKSTQLIDGLDKLIIVHHSNGNIEYRLHLVGFYVFHVGIGLLFGLLSQSITIGIIVFLIAYTINYFAGIRRHEKFMNKKIMELQYKLQSNDLNK